MRRLIPFDAGLLGYDYSIGKYRPASVRRALVVFAVFSMGCILHHQFFRATRSANCRAGAGGSEFSVARTRDQVIIDHAGRLHMGVDDRGADEAETAMLEFL